MMFPAFLKLLHFIHLSVNLYNIVGGTNDLGDDLIACSHVVWDTRPMWDDTYEFYPNS
jgi:hypothetical protein